jgi:hypothetical protein
MKKPFELGDAEFIVGIRRVGGHDRNDVQHFEIGLELLGELDGAIEAVEGWLAEIDRTEDFFDRKHRRFLSSAAFPGGGVVTLA